MKFNAFSPIAFLIFLFCFFFVPRSSASFYDAPWENQTLPNPGLTLEPNFSFLTTSMNFDPNGAASIPSGFQSYQKMRFGSKAAIQIFDGLTLYGVFSVTSVQVTTSSFTGSQLQLGDQVLGANLRVLSFGPRTFLFLQGEGQVPLYSNASSASSNLPFVGDGSIDFTGGPIFRWNILDDSLKRLSLDIGTGYSYRTGGFSGHVPYIFGAKLNHFEKGFWVGLDLLGIFSLGSDRSTNQGFSEPLSAAGGSFAVNGVNPSLLNIRFRGGYRPSAPWAITFQAHQTLWGKSAPKSSQFILGLEWKLLDSEESKQDSPKPSPQNEFVTYDRPSQVTDVNDRLNLVKINHGRDHGLRVGQRMTIFKTTPDGQVIEAIARATVKELKSNEAILKVDEYFKEVWIEKGFVVKRPLE